MDYDREKIAIAIQRANEEVNLEQRADRSNIKSIMLYIEDLGKKRILVEDIQDIVEQKLIEQEKYELAKRYIDYRYEKTLASNEFTNNEEEKYLNVNSEMMFAGNI